MQRIAVGEAIGAGFGLIRREPVTFLVWCAAYFLVSAVPQAFVWPQMMQVYQSMGSDPQAVLAAQSRMGAYQPISLILALAIFAVMPAAIFRAALFPDDRRFFYLRLGLREFWTLIVSIVVAIIWFLGFIVMMIPVLLLTFGAAAAAGGAGGAAIAFILVIVGYLVGIGGSIWLVLRFSLAPVMSFAENTFRVPESWRLTKGHAWRIFLVALGLSGMVILAELVLFGGAFAFLAAGRPNLGQVFTDPGAIPALMSQITVPMMLGAYAVFTVFGVWSYVMGGAAWASLYRQLKPALAETFS
jgi:hypothetical protein